MAFSLFTIRLAAADLTGHWSFDGDVNGSPIRLECDLKQEGTKLEGACKSQSSDFKLAGEVNDPKVRFSYAVDYQGSTYTLYYTGTLDSDSAMKGEIQVSGASGAFTAARQAAAKL
ncbi:MAG: hypothetical protein QOJ99_3753 [Bryobacterales bacterium]|nr:hypothetical protein [Bryobacterales bacterium]